MKKILLIGMILLNLCLVLAGGFDVDLYSTNVTGDSATLVVRARGIYDTQIEWIKIYENGVEIYTENCIETQPCNGDTYCICVCNLDVTFPETGQVNYYAKARNTKYDDPSEITSNVLTFNLAPIITFDENSDITKTINPSGDIEVIITWLTDVDSTSVVKYSLNSNENYPYSKIGTSSPSGSLYLHTVTLTDLIEGETYYFIIESTDSDNKTSVSNEYSFVFEDPNAPTIKNLESEVIVDPITKTITSITIRWETFTPDGTSPLSTDGVVYYKSENDTIYTSIDENRGSQNDHRVSLPTTLDDGSIYTYYVESVDSGCTAVSSKKTFTIPDLSAPVISSVQETDVYLTSARIKWDTDEASDSKVRYGTASNVYDNEVSDDNFVMNHNLLLDNLLDGETYYYIIESTDVDGNVGTYSERVFTTGRLIISFSEPDEDEEFYIGDVIEGELRIENADVSDIEVDVEIILYDDTEDDEIEEIEFDKKEVEAGDYRSFDFEFDIDYNIDEGNDYKIIAEVRADGTTYKHEIDIDVDRKANDVRVENMRVNRIGDRLEVNLDVINYGKRDQENVYVEVSVFGLGLNKISDDFSLEDWEGSNRAYRRFSFDLPLELDEGVYSVEAALHYGSSFDYVTKDFEVRGPVSLSESIFRVQDSVVTSGLDYSEDDAEVMKKVTWGIVDFLLLCVVIYGFVWLINNR